MQKARIEKRFEWAPGLITVTLDRVADEFEAGQFFNLGLTKSDELPPSSRTLEPPAPEKPTRRSYSAASAPGQKLEFFINEVPDGELTPRMFQLTQGEEVLFDPRGLGYFTLTHVPEAKTLWLVATGTGLGPYVSMLRDRKGLERFERVVLVHGARLQSNLAYAEEFDRLARELPLTYVPAVSRDGAPLHGVAGRITTNLESGALEEKAGVALDASSQVMLCGHPTMVDEVVKMLGDRGLKKHRKREPGNVHYERYW